MRVLIVSQMWPGPDDPDLGAFVAQVAGELELLGLDVDHAVLDTRKGGPARHLRLLSRTLRAQRPDVAFAHFLVPTGLTAVLAARAPVVVMAHGNDVANAERYAPLRRVTRFVVRRAAATIANSRHTAARLEAITGIRAEVIDCGVDMERFAPGVDAVAWHDEQPRLLCVGSLTARKNVIALANAFARFGRGSLLFLGDGPLRSELEGRPGVRVLGRVPHADVPAWIAACDVLCQPSLVEPFGQATLEAMAMERTVVATSVGGPPEFVTPDAGVLVDPEDVVSIADGLRRASVMPTPNPAGRLAAEGHDARRQAARMADVLTAAAERGR